jgi:hypothetical protein
LRNSWASDLVTTLQALVDVQLALGQEAEALPVLEKSVRLLRRLPAPGEPKQLAEVLVLLGQIYLAQEQAERQKREEPRLRKYWPF